MITNPIGILLNRIKLDKVNGTLLRLLIVLCGHKIAYTSRRYDSLSQETVLNATLLLPGKGCSWVKESGAGCTMCGFKNALSSIGMDREFRDEEVLCLFNLGINTLEKKYPCILNIYNGGSFLNDEEISCDVQTAIIKRIQHHDNIKTIFIESRPEFIVAEKLEKLISLLAPKSLKVGIGLEALTDRIRNDYINKGISRDIYEKAVRLAKTAGAKILTYVLIKPPYLTEAESIEEAVKTCKYAFGAGSDEVSFEAACVQKGTQMEELFNQDRYSPPWLWSIIEVIKATHNLGDVQIGSFRDFPRPMAKPQNCWRCSARVERALDNYRMNHELSVFNGLYCSCREEWQKELVGTIRKCADK
jgi:radical SAM enzyme (TIGR01210 family)